MKKKDALLLAHLRKNARLPMTVLSRRTGLPVSTIFDKIKAYQDDVFLRHSALLSFRALGFSTTAHIMLKVDKSKKSALMDFLSHCWFVNSLFRINNGWDVMLECVFRDMCSVEEFVERLERDFGVMGKDIHYVLEELKREAFLTDVSSLDLVFPKDKL